MINKIMNNLFGILIGIIDYPNKKKILNFFKSKLKDNHLKIIDIGAHKGETINFFLNNFRVGEIYAFEPNLDLYEKLKKINKFKKKFIRIFNFGIGYRDEIKTLNNMTDSSSSTINSIDEDTKNLKKKKKILSLFSSNKNFLKKRQEIKITSLSQIIFNNNINRIDVLKIDTEGYEYNVLKGIKLNDFKKINYIYFEHHYDLMIKKGYKFSDINFLLNQNNFYKKYKLKMNFRKSFEYIYENSEK